MTRIDLISKIELSLILCAITLLTNATLATTANTSKPATTPQPSDTAPIKSGELKAITTATRVPAVVPKRGPWGHKMKGIEYPQFVGGDASVCAKLNSAMRGFVRRQVAVNYGDLYEWSVEKTFVAPKAVSAKFHVSTFGEGAAHRIARIECFDYQTVPSVRQINLNDLFGKKVDYKVLNPICERFVAADLSKGGINDPTYTKGGWLSPDAYTAFAFDDAGVTFAFNMGVEALNAYNVKVPYGDLKVLFARSSPIYSLVTHASPRGSKPALQTKTIDRLT